MTKVHALALLVLIFGSISACNQSKYHWGNYEGALHSYYKNPEKRGDLTAALFDVIRDSEKMGKPVPPGVCAEYGFALYLAGKNEKAVEYLRREKATWPESTYLMDRLIARIGTPDAAQGTDVESTPPLSISDEAPDPEAER